MKIASKHDLTALRFKLSKAADLMTELPINQWAGGVVYLLETLDKVAHDRDLADDYNDTLDDVREDIGTRLNLGRW